MYIIYANPFKHNMLTSIELKLYNLLIKMFIK